MRTNYQPLEPSQPEKKVDKVAQIDSYVTLLIQEQQQLTDRLAAQQELVAKLKLEVHTSAMERQAAQQSYSNLIHGHEYLKATHDSHLKRYQEQQRQLIKLNAQRNECTKQLKVMQNQIHCLQAQLNQKTQKLAVADLTVNQRSQQVSSMTVQQSQISADISRLNKELHDRDQCIAVHQNTILNLQQANQFELRKQSQLQKGFINNQQQNRALIEELDKLKRQRQHFLNNERGLSVEADRKNHNMIEMGQRISYLEEQDKQKTAEIGHLLTVISNLEKELEAIRESLSAAKRAKEQAESANITLRQQFSFLNVTLDQMTREHSAHNDFLDRTEQEIAKQRNRHLDDMAEIERLNVQLAHHKSKVVSIRDEISNQYENEIVKLIEELHNMQLKERALLEHNDALKRKLSQV